MSDRATDKQIQFILSLWNELNPDKRAAAFLSQTTLPLTQREKSGGMTKAEASRHITNLKAKLGKPG